jgi:hypothetical protein
MRTTILLVIATFLFNHISAQESNDTIQAIEQTVKTINEESDLWSTTVIDEAFLDTAFLNQPALGYGRLTGYFKNGKLCKITEVLGLKLLQEHAVTEYYFSKGQLIYVNEKEKIGPNMFIDSEGTIDYRIDEPSFEVMYYFTNEQLILSNEKGERQTMLLPNQEFFDSQSKEGQLLDSAKKYYEFFSDIYKE